MSKQAKWSVSGGVILLVAAALVFQFVSASNHNSSSPTHFGVASVKAAEPIGHIGTGKCAEAVEQAGSADKYVYAVFYRDDNDQLTRARGLVESARKQVTRKSAEVEINVADPAEQDIVNKYGASRAQMPLILVLAPNGAIMGGYPAMQLTDETMLVECVGCKASEQAMKALQSKNMVAFCMQNKQTADNAGAMRGVEEFLKDAKYGQSTAVVMADPSDPATAKFATKLGLDPQSPVAVTALLAPPGTVIGVFQGATPKDKIVAAVQAAAAPKAGGCCPPGSGKSCGPTATAAPQNSPPPVKVVPVPSTSTSAKPPTPPKGK
ncbi:hypothetical protein HZB60_09180 [candidate division KSB1 bacterium]|nr:hypothetical protein [candidate division KSB1 bacterium]